MTKLETERLRLREFELSDWRAVHSYASDPEVVRYMSWGPNKSKSETKAFIQRAMGYGSNIPRTRYGLAVILKKSNELIGSCSIEFTNPEQKTGSIGYCYHKAHWGKGYATEAAKAILEFGFKQLKLHRIYANCDPANIASQRVLEKAGMTQEAHLRENVWEKGKWHDTLIFAILRKEWA